MKFSDRLKELREKNDMTQEQLAKVSGVSPRTIQRYECGTSRPRLDAAEKLAKALNISVDQLLGTDGMLVAQAAEQYGARGAKQAQQLTDEVTGLFTGGEFAQDDMDVMMQAIMDAYWLAKEKNKKYTPKRFLAFLFVPVRDSMFRSVDFFGDILGDNCGQKGTNKGTTSRRCLMPSQSPPRFWRRLRNFPPLLPCLCPAADRFNGYFNAVICLACFSGGGIVNCADL